MLEVPCNQLQRSQGWGVNSLRQVTPVVGGACSPGGCLSETDSQCLCAAQGLRSLSVSLEIKVLMENQSSTQRTSLDESVSNRNHRDVPALGSRKPHFEIFKLKSSKLASSSKNIEVQRQTGSKRPVWSYLDFLVSVQLLPSRHKSQLWLIVLGLPGATQVLRGIYTWWCAQKQVQVKRHFMIDKRRM